MMTKVDDNTMKVSMVRNMSTQLVNLRCQ